MKSKQETDSAIGQVKFDDVWILISTVVWMIQVHGAPGYTEVDSGSGCQDRTVLSIKEHGAKYPVGLDFGSAKQDQEQ